MERFQLAPPLLHIDTLLFADSTTIAMELGFSGVEIYYTIDGSTPDRTKNLYTGPVTLTEACTIKAGAFKQGWLPSDVVSREFLRYEHRAESAALERPPHSNYPGDGAQSLIDLVAGDSNFRSPNWLGFEDENLDAVIDMGRELQLDTIGLSTVADHGAWIFHPVFIQLWGSKDGESYSELGSHRIPVPTSQQPLDQRFWKVEFEASSLRYVKIHAQNLTVVPEWHGGAGGKAWLFVDEVIIG